MIGVNFTKALVGNLDDGCIKFSGELTGLSAPKFCFFHVELYSYYRRVGYDGEIVGFSEFMLKCGRCGLKCLVCFFVCCANILSCFRNHYLGACLALLHSFESVVVLKHKLGLLNQKFSGRHWLAIVKIAIRQLFLHLPCKVIIERFNEHGVPALGYYVYSSCRYVYSKTTKFVVFREINKIEVFPFLETAFVRGEVS